MVAGPSRMAGQLTPSRCLGSFFLSMPTFSVFFMVPLATTKTHEFCSKPYCGALIPQSVNRHLDAGRLINFFIWQSSCCQLHTSVPARDKITFPIKMNTHASAFLLGRFPPQCCGVVYCHVLKSLRLDVVPDIVPHAAQT